jgi:ligand-binding sensor domain-containing protein
MIKDGLVNNFVRVFLQGSDGSVWIATDEGVSRWFKGGFTNFQERDGLCTSALARWRKTTTVISVGTDGGISHIHDGKFCQTRSRRVLAKKRFSPTKIPMEACVRHADWRVYRWRSGKLIHYTTAQGLANNSIYELLEDRNRTFWISGPMAFPQSSGRN